MTTSGVWMTGPAFISAPESASPHGWTLGNAARITEIARASSLAG
jgi:hypothetical protein